MGLIKAALGSAGGVLADQWKDYFTCDSMPADVLIMRGRKKQSGRSSNKKGDADIITNGSVIAVAEGQCMLITEQGKIVDVCAEPGEYTYDMSTEPSVFSGDLGEDIKAVFRNIGKRFTFGGEAPKDQRVYYVNTKEIIGNKYGTPSPIPFRVVDERAAIDIDISVRCFGVYSYKVVNPLLLYTALSGNVADVYTRDNLDGQLKSELLTKLQPAFARISAMGVRYSAIPGHTAELADALREELTADWRDGRGIEMQSIGVSSIKASEEDEKLIKEMQRDVAYMDERRAAGRLAGARAAAMEAAANNPNGAMMGFMGMGMAAGVGGMSEQQLFQMANQKEQAQVSSGWTCACGQGGNTGKFCQNCGKPMPAPKGADGWTCSCGAVNKGKFCAECGSKKPSGVPQYKCDKCGWEPEDPTKAPKFCPECGDPFDAGDIVG
ncbi:MAG: SPFH domain-containing protein [Lachnospiraceae bacterium]|nr:SPFH domain-containing protein [Lachnospiraceae bacterium]